MANNNIKEKRKNSFLRDILKSIKDFDKYEDFGLEGLGKTLLYLLKIVAILVLIVTSMSLYQFSNNINDLVEYFEANIENVEYDNGILMANNNEKTEKKSEDFLGNIIINTSDVSDLEIEEYLASNNNVIIFLKDKVIIKNQALSNISQTNYSDLFSGYNIDEMDKQTILTNFYKNRAKVYLGTSIVLYIYMFIIYFTSVLLDALLLSVVGFIIARIMKMRIAPRAMFGMSVHAMTLPIILNLIYVIVNKLTGWTVQYFQLMYTTISYIYIVTALFMIRADFIKRQIELDRIKTEQQKIHEELELKRQKEDDEKQRQKERKEKEKQEKKEQEENNSSKDVGDKPEGSNA